MQKTNDLNEKSFLLFVKQNTTSNLTDSDNKKMYVHTVYKHAEIQLPKQNFAQKDGDL